MKRSTILVILLLAVILLAGCRTTEAPEVEPIDYGPGIELLFDTRPNNNELYIIEDVKTIDDIVSNSATYLMAWELWEVYAESLEDYLNTIRNLQRD